MVKSKDAYTRRDFLKTLKDGFFTLTAIRYFNCGGNPLNESIPPLGVEYVDGWDGLSTLPWFYKGLDNRIHCKVDLGDAIDFHTHLGFSYLDAPKIDLMNGAKPIKYLIDCDNVTPKCKVEFDIYINQCATKDALERMNKEILDSVTPSGSKYAETHTIPNLLGEMDGLGFQRAVIHAIDIGIGQRNPTEEWLESIYDSKAKNRVYLFGSIHPERENAVSQVKLWKEKGIVGLKIHPVQQRIAPDHPSWQGIYAICEELNLPIFYHCGRTGIEPDFLAEFANGSNYIQPINDYPNITFVLGHSGALMDFDKAIQIAKASKNVYLDLHGRGIYEIEEMIKLIGPDRIVFGSDWPFYPVAAMLARLLHVTRDDSGLRREILVETPKKILSQFK